MRRVLWRGSQAIELLRWQERHTTDTFVEFHETSAALDFLRPHLDDPVSMRTLRDTLAEELGHLGMVGLDDQEVLDQLAWRLVWDDVRVTPSVTSRPAVQAGIYKQAAAPEAEGSAVAPAAVEERTAWIEIELVDEEGTPVAGEKYRIELPDGSIREGVLDANGRAHIDGLDPGICTIAFPNLDASEWQSA